MRKCKVCKDPYTPTRPLQSVCGRFECAINQGRAVQEKARRKAFRARKEHGRTRSDWIKLAQTDFNRFIRLRDSDLPCISCGRMHEGQWHASHYRPTGQNSALRFNEINCHRACQPCNTHKSGNLIPYRLELVNRIGLELVEWLEKDHPKVTPWEIEELQAIRKYYQRAVKALMNGE